MNRLPRIGLGLAIAEFNARRPRLVDALMEADSTVPLMDAMQIAENRLAGEPGSPAWRKLRQKQAAVARVRGIVASIRKASRNTAARPA